eukprot:scaffold2697_cov346-Pavlova_lutheri.AAC.24
MEHNHSLLFWQWSPLACHRGNFLLFYLTRVPQFALNPTHVGASFIGSTRCGRSRMCGALANISGGENDPGWDQGEGQS